MGTDLESVLEDIAQLMEHLKYFSECKGVYSKEIQIEINLYSRMLTDLARIIQDSK